MTTITQEELYDLSQEELYDLCILYNHLYFDENESFSDDFEKTMSIEWNNYCSSIIARLRIKPIITVSTDKKDILANECLNCLINVVRIPIILQTKYQQNKNAFKKMKKKFNEKIEEYYKAIKVAYPQLQDIEIDVKIAIY